MRNITRYLSLLLFPIITLGMSIALSSCGDDNEEDGLKQFPHSVVHLKIGDGEPESFYAYNSIFDEFETDEGEEFISFHVAFSKDMKKQYGTLGFITEKGFKPETEITSDFLSWRSDDEINLFRAVSRGSVTVRSIKNDEITLRFKNFQFERDSDIPGRYIILNGDICFQAM